MYILYISGQAWETKQDARIETILASAKATFIDQSLNIPFSILGAQREYSSLAKCMYSLRVYSLAPCDLLASLDMALKALNVTRVALMVSCPLGMNSTAYSDCGLKQLAQVDECLQSGPMDHIFSQRSLILQIEVQPCHSSNQTWFSFQLKR